MRMRRLLVAISLFGVLALAVLTTAYISPSSSTIIMADGDEYGNGGG